MYDVAIVGTGPVGAVAANLCGVHGLTAVAFDREADVYDLPRGAAIDDEVQRILAHARVLDAVLPHTREHRGGEFVDAAGRRIVGVDLPEGLRTPNGYPPLLGIAQPGLERAIRAGLAAHPGVALRVRHEVLEIDQQADHVTLVVRDVTRGCSERVQARWLVGCDGASSFVRKSSGIAWESLGYDHEWLVVDVSLRRDVALPPLAQQICDPARPVTIVPMPRPLHRWEFQLLPGETRAEMEDPDRVWALLAPWLTRDDADVLRAVVYRFHATIADTFRRGRVFLAGDAAHQTPPFLGQGMCTGIRDAGNLVWKLDAVRGGRAGDALLDTYTDERRPLAVAMVEHSVNIGRLIDAYAGMARGGPEPPEELKPYAYGGGKLLPHLATGLLATDTGPWVGRLAPQCEVPTPEGARRLDPVVGSRWAVIGARDPRSLMSAETMRLWERLGVALMTLPEPTGAMSALLQGHDAVVVRPDRIVYAMAGETASLDAIAPRLTRAVGLA